MGRDIIARGMASGAIKVNINAGHIFIDNIARDAYFVTNPSELVENMYVYCDSKLQQYDGSIWVDRTPAIKGETGTGVPIGGTTNQVLTKNSNSDYDFSWIDLSGGGDMVKSFYDTADKQVDVYDMDNMEDGTTYVRTENNYDDIDKAKVDALDLDTLVPYTGADKDVNLGNNAISANKINLKNDYIPTGLEPVGSTYYNVENACLSTVLPNGVTLENGQELHATILNNTGSTITDGSVVYISGAVGNSSSLTGALFIADGTINSSLIAGVTTHDILNGQKGKITHFGLVRGINTTGIPYGETWEEGDVIYASPTIAGRITNVQPQAPNLTVILGYVVNKHTNGLLSIKLNSGAKLTDLHDINGTPLDTSGQIMVWDETRKVFDFDYNINDYKLNDVKSGTTVSISDAEDNVYFNNIVVNGKTTQKTYDGVQIIPFTLDSLKSGNTAGIWSGNNYTVSGITFVVSTDSENNVTSITALGTASANVTLMLKTPSDGKTIATATSHTLTGCPTGGSGTTYYLRVQNYEDSAGTVWKSNQDDIGSGKVFLTNYLYFNCYIRINSGVTVSNKIFTPMLTTTAVRPHIYEPYVGNIPSPNTLFPQPLVGVGNDLSLSLTVGIDNLNTDDTQITLTLPNPIYQSDFLGLYNKDICILKNITYDETKEGLWGIFQNSNKIVSYNSETVIGDYDSTTGELDSGATIVYYENTDFTFIPLIASEQDKLNTLKQKGYSMYISNDDVANMEIYYNTKNLTTKILSSKISTHIEDTNSHGAYSIIKQTLAEDGYIATYQLTKNGTPLGSKINIPKDYLVKSGTLQTCSQNNVPVSGYIIGDKYLDFIVNTTENTGNQTHIYIKVTDLIDIYTEGNGIDITNNSISVVINSVSNGLFVNSGGVGLNVATTNTNGAFSSGEKTKLNNIKKSIIAETTANLLTVNWVGSVAPYSVDIVLSIPDYTVTSDNDINISPIYSSNQTTAQSQMEAYSYLSRGEIISDNTIRFTCYDYKPSVDLSINIEILKDFAQEELMNYIDSKVTEISSIDLNALFDVGLYLGYGCTNTPIQTSLGYFSLQVHGKTNNIVQILVDTTTSYVYTRSYTGTWTTWEKLSSSVKGMSYYATTHGAGANYGSGTWIAGDTIPTVDFKTKAKSTVVIGSDSLKNSTNMVDIIAIGDGIIPTGKGGEHNIGIGLWALHSLNIGTASASEYGDRNIAIGSLSYPALIDGRANTGLGRDTAQCCVHGSFDIAIGYQALAGQAPVNFKREIDHWWEGDYTHIIGVGYQAGQEIVSATADMFLGSFCGKQVKTGSYSNLFGYNCGINLEYDKSYNGKKIVLVTESATYTTNGTVNIVVIRVGHQAVIGNYVTLTFTSGACNVLSSDIQLMYVNAVDGDTFTLTSPAIIENGSGNCTISRYEVEIPVGETLGLLNSSNIMGTGSCYFTKRVNQSNVFGMRSSNRTECDNMDIVGYSTFYGLGTGVVGVAKESQVIGAFACYNVDDILASSVIGYQAGYNATTRILDSVINGWKACYNATTIEQSIAIGEESLLNTTVIQNTVNVGGNTKHTYTSLKKCTFIGEMAGEGTDAGITALENSTAIGYNSAVTGDNQVQLGDVNTTTYVYGTVQNRSDMRDKADIRDTELGLDFINKLRPVDFKWNYRELYQDEVNNGSKKGSRYHHGLITQEVFDIIKETGKDFGGYQDHSLNGGSDVQSLGYDEFIAPLVKAVQELSEKCITLENRIIELENK